MASPTYGTNLSNYMNILAGQARGMNESERLSRMQEKQDYSQAFNMLQYEDRIGNRDAQQQQNYDWNAYNANLRQQNAQQDYDWNVYRDSLRQEQRGYQRGRDTINDAARKEALGYNRDRQGRQDKLQNINMLGRAGFDVSPLIQELMSGVQGVGGVDAAGTDARSRMAPFQLNKKPESVEDRYERLQSRLEMANKAINNDPAALAATGAPASVPDPDFFSWQGAYENLGSVGQALYRNPLSPAGWIDRYHSMGSNRYNDRPIFDNFEPMFDYRTKDEKARDVGEIGRQEGIMDWALGRQ